MSNKIFNDKITFSELSMPLKTAVILTFIIDGILAITFLIGFIQGLLGI